MGLIRCDAVVSEGITAMALLAWVYRDQKADRMSGKELHRPEAEDEDEESYHGGWSGDGCAAVAQMGRTGAIVRSTAHQQRPALHPDAETVHDLVVELSRSDPLGAELLRRHGRRGDMPDFWDVVPTPGPVRRRTGNNRLKLVEDATLPGNSHLECRLRRIRGTSRRTRVWVEVFYPFCPLTYSPSFEAVAEAQAEYRAWWRALTRLAAALPPLKRWRLDGLGAEETPWQRPAPPIPAGPADLPRPLLPNGARPWTKTATAKCSMPATPRRSPAVPGGPTGPRPSASPPSGR